MNSTMEYKAAVKNGVGRMVFVVLSMLIEVVVLLFFIFKLGMHGRLLLELTHFIALAVVLYIYSQNINANMKMPWMILMVAMPVFGIVLYLLIGFNGSTAKMRREYFEIDTRLLPLLSPEHHAYERAKNRDRRLGNLMRYIYNYSGYPACDDTDIVYYDDGAKGIEAQKEDLKKAEKFIFMEYHAIEDAESWHSIQEILVDRVKAGVEVRVFYDDMGSIGFINTDFVNKMEELGIKCKVFNAFAPGFNIFLNNRDHRKITVVDGQVGFTGGYNLANEYFHITEPYGFWKDTGVRITGSAVDSLTLMFLEMWNAVAKKDERDTVFEKYLMTGSRQTSESDGESKGIVQIYPDSPLDDVPMGEDVYISMAGLASDYVWFVTPYLIITDVMAYSLSMAAKRGVDVRIITPGIPDKKLIYSVTRSFYSGLVKNGVRVFEYTPGFCHAKMSIADDIAATCGTINMDYRSLYHHFENGCLFADCDAVMDVKRDFEAMFEVSKEVTADYKGESSLGTRLFQMMLKLMAPLL